MAEGVTTLARSTTTEGKIMVVRNITILDHVVGETEVETVATTVATAGISAVVSREATSVVKFICVH